MQIELIGIAAAASVAHAIRDHTSRKSKLLLGSGLLMASVLSFTFIAILPINKRLQSEQEQPDAQVGSYAFDSNIILHCKRCGRCAAHS